MILEDEGDRIYECVSKVCFVYLVLVMGEIEWCNDIVLD